MTPAIGASFDCSLAGTKIEHMICENDNINKLDEELNVLYKNARSNPSVVSEQKEWIKMRNGVSTPRELENMYLSRVQELSSRAVGNTKFEIVKQNRIVEKKKKTLEELIVFILKNDVYPLDGKYYSVKERADTGDDSLNACLQDGTLMSITLIRDKMVDLGIYNKYWDQVKTKLYIGMYNSSVESIKTDEKQRTLCKLQY
ncbi:hypothetical protein ZPAH1_orf00288 [Aeromonas phage ZPAH1]|nr:hypothetical protein ZPAH1_orf00288 [Aeromonas phage ZPAH1]